MIRICSSALYASNDIRRNGVGYVSQSVSWLNNRPARGLNLLLRHARFIEPRFLLLLTPPPSLSISTLLKLSYEVLLLQVKSLSVLLISAGFYSKVPLELLYWVTLRLMETVFFQIQIIFQDTVCSFFNCNHDITVHTCPVFMTCDLIRAGSMSHYVQKCFLFPDSPQINTFDPVDTVYLNRNPNKLKSINYNL